MPKTPRHIPVGHLFEFPDAVRAWMLSEVHGHMAFSENNHCTVYCGCSRGSFRIDRLKPNQRCRFCHEVIQEGSHEDRQGGFILWHHAR